MHIPFLFPSRCVLLMEDEGLLVYEATPARIHFVDLLSWETANFEQTLARLISKKTRGKRVLILNDMVEQHYRKERVPHAGPLYRFVLLRRRLAEVFRPHPIRAALRLKEEGASLSEQRSLRQEERGFPARCICSRAFR